MIRSVCFVRKEVVARTWYGGIDIPNGCKDPEGYVKMNEEDIELSHMQDEEILEIHPIDHLEVDGED